MPGKLIVVEPVVAFAAMVTVPVNGPAFGVAQAILIAYAPGAPMAGAPVTALLIVTTCGLIGISDSGFVTVTLFAPPLDVANAAGSVAAPH